ncbi:hypothetical protein KCP75_23145 [Salmonella enterica subsp. enterica]|nr:hypothetical protein KCP75_23145 [Salmonella enterica subsp. enterica]
MSGINSNHHFIASACRRAPQCVTVLLLVTPVRRSSERFKRITGRLRRAARFQPFSRRQAVVVAAEHRH